MPEGSLLASPLREPEGRMIAERLFLQHGLVQAAPTVNSCVRKIGII